VSSLQPKTVLIIDDDPLFQEDLTGALVGAGYRVKNTYDGEAGLQSIFKEAPDLVVLDLILPKKIGFEVLREIKQREETNQPQGSPQNRPTESGLGLGCFTPTPPVEASLFSCANSVDRI
jgi:CheY-like chemotaxis protein